MHDDLDVTRMHPSYTSAQAGTRSQLLQRQLTGRVGCDGAASEWAEPDWLAARAATAAPSLGRLVVEVRARRHPTPGVPIGTRWDPRPDQGGGTG